MAYILIIASNATNISTKAHNVVEEIMHPKNSIITVEHFKYRRYLFGIFVKKYFKDDSPS